jgi:phosphoadenosine phosphosulfate reductase
MTIAIVTPTPELAAEADARFEGIADPVEQALAVLTWAGETFGDSFAITSSMADGLLAHLASRAVPGVNVVFLDTGYHFAETIGTRDWITSVLPITLHNDVDAYIAEHQVPVNPLQEIGYASIGCEPCTRPVAPGEDPRAGRWAGKNKVECGLHL